MTLAFVFYCGFVPLSVFGGGALEAIGWNGTLVTVLMMVINFVLEFIWDKFVVFNDRVTNTILGWFKKEKQQKEENVENKMQNSTEDNIENEEKNKEGN